MKKMQGGFTMIELIFVIVIIGILAAVAIPKLAATRDDARISTCAHEASLFLREVSAYYTAHKQLGSLSVMTNLDISGAPSGLGNTDKNMTATGSVATYNCEGNSAVIYTYTNSGGLVDLNVSKPAALAGLAKPMTDLLEKNGFFKVYRIGGSSGLTY